MSANWIFVNKRHEVHGEKPPPEPTMCWVNADLIHTIEPLTHGGSVIGWFTGGPRATWRVNESVFELMRRMSEEDE